MRISFLAVIVVFISSTCGLTNQSASAQPTLGRWLEERAVTLSPGLTPNRVGALIDQANESKQPEIPVISVSAQSLTENTDVPGFVSSAIQIAGIVNSETNPASVTITPYAAKAFISRRDPSDPDYYEERSNVLLRRFALSIGYDNSDVTNAAGDKFQRGTLLSGKWIVFGSRNVSDYLSGLERRSRSPRENDLLAAIVALQGDIAVQGLNVEKPAVDYLVTVVNSRPDNFAALRAALPGAPDVATFASQITNKVDRPNFKEDFLPLLKESETARLDDLIRRSGLPSTFSRYFEFTRQFAQEIRNLQNRPQLAVSYETKLRSRFDDDYLAQIIYDGGGKRDSKWALNASYGRKLDDMSTTNKGLRLSAKYTLPTGDENPADGDQPNRLSVAAEADRSGSKDIYRTQVQYLIPLADGINLPISLTFANRREFIDEGKVKGHIGITIDYEKIKLSDLLKQLGKGKNGD